MEEEEDEVDHPRVNATLRHVRADGLLAPNVDPGAAEYDRHSRYEAETGFGSALFDARNGFNELNRYLMLWNVAHLWNQESRFAFNRYRHWVRCLVRTELGILPVRPTSSTKMHTHTHLSSGGKDFRQSYETP